MKKLAMALLGVMLLGAAQLTAGPRVVFMGDSITRLWGSNKGSWFTENNFSCKGTDGQTTRNMLQRFQSDVINAAPQVVVIGAGTNDISCRWCNHTCSRRCRPYDNHHAFAKYCNGGKTKTIISKTKKKIKEENE